MGQHGVVLIFVIQLEDLNKVVKASLVLGVLAGLVHGEHIVFGEHLLALLGLSSDFLNGLNSGVEVAGPDKVSNIEGIYFTISFEVIDIKSKVNGVNFLLLQSKFSHFVAGYEADDCN